jgi:hypothetical protein
VSKISIGKLNRHIDESIHQLKARVRDDEHEANPYLIQEMQDACDAIHAGTERMFKFMESQRSTLDAVRGVVDNWEEFGGEDRKFALELAVRSMREMIELSQWLVEHPYPDANRPTVAESIPTIYE